MIRAATVHALEELCEQITFSWQGCKTFNQR
jgi:hypothetical protein